MTGQKGVPLIKHAAFRTVERGGQFVLLGSAPDPKVQVRQCARPQSSSTGDVAMWLFYQEYHADPIRVTNHLCFPYLY